MHPSLDHLHEESRRGWEFLPNNFGSNGLRNAVVVANAHELYGFTVNNTNASAQFVLFFDQVSLPADGAVPDMSFTVNGAADKGLLWLPPRKVLRGIVLCNSSLAGTKAIGAADCAFDVQYL